jgi:hypothetical protein
MAIQLGPELQHALQAGHSELEVVDPSTNQHYIIVAKERWLERTLAGQAIAHQQGSCGSDPACFGPWTDEKNRRRADLVDRQIAGTLTDEEQTELEGLQHQMRAYREQVAPLDLEATRRLHAELMEKARKAQP